MDVVESYYISTKNILKRILNEEKKVLENASKIIANTIKTDHIVHVIGAGHSAMLGEELFYRAGGLASVSPVLDADINTCHGAWRATKMEDLKGYAEILLKNNGVRAGDNVIVISTSGVNQFPVEAAVVSKGMGATTIGITSINYSRNLMPNNEYGKRLFEVVDVVIDNKVPPGDAILEIDGLKVKVASVSTITNSFIGNTIVGLVVEKLFQEGITPPVWLSAHVPGAEEHNLKLFELYRGKIRLL